LSFHVKTLAAAGLISARQQGRSLYYSSDPAVVRELIAYLVQNCCGAALASNNGELAIAADGAFAMLSKRAMLAVPKPNIRPKNRAG
jgi:hypothetical protein